MKINKAKVRYGKSPYDLNWAVRWKNQPNNYLYLLHNTCVYLLLARDAWYSCFYSTMNHTCT
jgi:hypothetical protein